MGNDVRSQICCGCSDRHRATFPTTSRRGGPMESAGAQEVVAKPREDPDKKIVEDIQRFASRIETQCKKFPTSGRATLLSGAKDRYIAAVPGDDSSNILGTGWSKWRNRWRRGRLAYWASRADFESSKPPRGELDLVNITKVHWDYEHPDQITIKHFEGREPSNLTIRLTDSRKAEQWRDALRSLRSLL
mmetsp:Transcript_104757/g.312951  ORF Transcript_104757/g.312951 Transcript_104757/m.312951 type:complete len:189 (-) Transcript_104757:215-781(-)